MSQAGTKAKKAVELQEPARPSRIRREPPPRPSNPNSLVGRINWSSREWEIRLAVIGIAFVGFAIAAAIIDIGHVLSY